MVLNRWRNVPSDAVYSNSAASRKRFLGGSHDENTKPVNLLLELILFFSVATKQRVTSRRRTNKSNYCETLRLLPKQNENKVQTIAVLKQKKKKKKRKEKSKERGNVSLLICSFAVREELLIKTTSQLTRVKVSFWKPGSPTRWFHYSENYVATTGRVCFALTSLAPPPTHPPFSLQAAGRECSTIFDCRVEASYPTFRSGGIKISNCGELCALKVLCSTWMPRSTTTTTTTYGCLLFVSSRPARTFVSNIIKVRAIDFQTYV